MKTKSISTNEFYALAKDLHGIDLSLGYDGGVMGEPIVEICKKQGHRFYYEQGNKPRCPYCLNIDLISANEKIEQLGEVNKS